ncbi:hypothetical protein HAX54_003401 [Datura stramonium]|uniref:Uncharacterized protein n=1 Tax=Datura stramonium TaxID=4076 RepID=A0ABS8WWR9_DATST|nr:hypothetical protein [Datura stramonium]
MPPGFQNIHKEIEGSIMKNEVHLKPAKVESTTPSVRRLQFSNARTSNNQSPIKPGDKLVQDNRGAGKTLNFIPLIIKKVVITVVNEEDDIKHQIKTMGVYADRIHDRKYTPTEKQMAKYVTRMWRCDVKPMVLMHADGFSCGILVD